MFESEVVNMDYINTNKEAWEEAFEHKQDGWGDENFKKLLNENYPFLYPDLLKELKRYSLEGKSVAQFCCNNGRELLSIIKGSNASSGVGFDIASNIIEQARVTAITADIPCSFEVCNILEVPETYHGKFDYIFVTIGAICWFKDLKEFFKKVSLCLNEGGHLIMHEIHPCTNMLAVPGEEEFDQNNRTKITWSYFKEEPFIDNLGIGYMAGESYKSKTFTSFTHTMAEILDSLVSNHLKLTSIKEFDYDVSGEFGALNGHGYPLSFIVTATKE